MNDDAEKFIYAIHHWADALEKIYNEFDGNDEGEITYDIKDASQRLIGQVEDVEDLIYKLAGNALLNPKECTMYLVVVTNKRTRNAYIKFDEKSALAKMREIEKTREFEKKTCIKMEGSNIFAKSWCLPVTEEQTFCNSSLRQCRKKTTKRFCKKKTFDNATEKPRIK